MPVAKVKMSLLTPGDTKPHDLEVATRISKTQTLVGYEELIVKILRHGWDEAPSEKYYEYGNDLLIWKVSSFEISESTVDRILSRAKNFKSVIIDLRGNGGGRVSTLKELVGYFFGKEMKIADEKRRNETKPQMSKTQGSKAFKGDLVVLIDHGSASASELFSRLIQLEKRGKVIGDKSAGAVMESRLFDMNAGVGSTLYFGSTVTIADLIMSDGKSLEKVGVTPDEAMLPSAQDLAEGKDPVLSYAAKLCHVDITPERAGSLFPIVWEK
jgi:C-terminal processing protease CtpA/Prc